MLRGLSEYELGRLRMSLGYGTHKKNRPLSPIEVGKLFERSRKAGSSLADCAIAVRLHETNVRRFIRILDLPNDLQYLIDWGGGKCMLSFSVAVELLQVGCPTEIRTITNAILEDGLDATETRQVVQLRKRSGRSVVDCVKEVVGMRVKIDKYHVFIGSVGNAVVARKLRNLTQQQRDGILRYGIDAIGLEDVNGKMGDRLFTMIGDKKFGETIGRVGQESIEVQMQAQIVGRLDCV